MLKNLSNKSVEELLLLLVIISLPFNMKFSGITVILLLTYILIKFDKKKYWGLLKCNFRLLGPTLYFLFVLIGVFYTDNELFALQKIQTQISLFIIPISIAIVNPTKDALTDIKRFFIYAMLAFSFISLLSLGLNYISHWDQRLHYNFIQRSMYRFHFPYDALYLNTAFIFLLFSTFKSIYKVLFSFIFLIIILLFSVRLGLLLYIFIAVFYGLFNIKQILNIRNFLFLGLIFLSVFFIHKQSRYANDKFYDTLDKLGFNTKHNVSETGEAYHNINERSFIWKESIDLIKEKPYFGYGTGGDRNALNDNYLKEGRTELLNLNAHNQYLSTILQYGIPGGILLVSLLLYLLVLSIMNKRLEPILFILLILSSFMTESFFARQKGIMFFSLFYPLMLLDNFKYRKG